MDNEIVICSSGLPSTVFGHYGFNIDGHQSVALRFTPGNTGELTKITVILTKASVNQLVPSCFIELWEGTKRPQTYITQSDYMHVSDFTEYTWQLTSNVVVERGKNYWIKLVGTQYSHFTFESVKQSKNPVKFFFPQNDKTHSQITQNKESHINSVVWLASSCLGLIQIEQFSQHKLFFVKDEKMFISSSKSKEEDDYDFIERPSSPANTIENVENEGEISLEKSQHIIIDPSFQTFNCCQYGSTTLPCVNVFIKKQHDKPESYTWFDISTFLYNTFTHCISTNY